MAESKCPLDQLGAHLKCSGCHNHLTVPPIVVLKDTGEYKCGRCSLTGQDRTGVNRKHPKELTYKTAVRDLPYEELAKDFLFPCKNQRYGCETYKKFQHLVEHEDHCPIHQYNFRCPMARSCEFPYCGLHRIYEHCLSQHQAEMCAKKWHSHVFTIPKDSEGHIDRIFFSSDNKIIFLLRMVKTGRVYAFTLRSLGTYQRFQFEIKPGKFRNDTSKKGEILFSNPLQNEENSVKLEVAREELEDEHEFQVDFVGRAKPEEIVRVPVKESEVLKCTKCHKYLSVKPVVATKNGYECGRCFKKTQVDKVRMKAYEILAEMVAFPCEESGCGKSFGIGEMKKHEDIHRSSKITK